MSKLARRSQSATGYTPTLGVAYGGLSGELFWYDRTDVWRDERLMRYVPRFIIEPHVRFKGQPGEQATMFLTDPSGNALEFKSFRDIAGQLFAK